MITDTVPGEHYYNRSHPRLGDDFETPVYQDAFQPVDFPLCRSRAPYSFSASPLAQLPSSYVGYVCLSREWPWCFLRDVLSCV